MQCSDNKRKLFWVKGVKGDLKPIKKSDSGYSWKWTKEDAQKLVKAHQDSRTDVKSAWNHGTMEINAKGKVLLPKYNDFLSDTRSLIQ